MKKISYLSLLSLSFLSLNPQPVEAGLLGDCWDSVTKVFCKKYNEVPQNDLEMQNRRNSTLDDVGTGDPSQHEAGSSNKYSHIKFGDSKEDVQKRLRIL